MRKYIKPSIIAIAIETEEILRASKPNMSIQPETENDVYMKPSIKEMEVEMQAILNGSFGEE